MASTFTCSTCNTVHNVTPARSGGAVGDRRGWGVPYKKRTFRVNKFGDGIAQDVTEAVYKTPVSSAASSMESNFKTPLSIALASGLFVFASGIVVFEFYPVDAIKVATILAGAVWAWQVAGDRALKWTERIIRRDIDGDGFVGEPEPKAGFDFTVTEERGNNRWSGMIRSPIAPSVLGEFARAIRSKRTTAESEWTGQGKPFSINEYVVFRDELLDRRLAEWNNEKHHRQGFRLTPMGEAIFKQLSDIPATTPPELLQ